MQPDETGQSMKNFCTTAALALGLALSGFAALAQDDAPAADAATSTDLAMGQPDPNAVGSTYTKETFESWAQNCVRTESGQDPCQMFQLLKDTDGTAVAEFNLFDLPEGGEAAAGATVIVPLETQLTAGLRIGVDEAKPKIYPFTFCAKIGCVARIGFTAEEITALQNGSKAVVTIVPAAAPDQQVVLDVSLKGFTAAFEAVKANNSALPQPEAAAEAPKE